MITYHSRMQPSARDRGRWHHWTGRILPILGVALLAAAPVHAKDRNKRHRDREVPSQTTPPDGNERAPRDVPPRDVPPREVPPREDLREPPRIVREVSLDRVIEQVERRHHARVVRSDTTASEGHKVYVLRLLSDEGRVWTVKVDAQTGQEQ